VPLKSLLPSDRRLLAPVRRLARWDRCTHTQTQRTRRGLTTHKIESSGNYGGPQGSPAALVPTAAPAAAPHALYIRR